MNELKAVKVIEKLLPQGYICHACGKSDHSIHDCLLKVSKKGKSVRNNQDKQVEKTTNYNIKFTNFVLEKMPTKKVIITGLPFDISRKVLKSMLEKDEIDARFIHLVTFDDNKAKCKGIAFVSVKDESSLGKLLQWNGREYLSRFLKVELVKVIDERSNLKNKSSTGLCYRCGEKHEPAACTNPRICYRCKSIEHLSSHCPHRKKTTTS
jgi:hypothetical protein